MFYMSRHIVLHSLVLLAASLLMGACDQRPDSQSLLQDAETAYASHNYDEAQALCDTLVLRARGGEQLGPDVACRVALILVRLGEVTNLEDENTAAAWQSLRMALEATPDTLADVIRRLPPDDQATLMMLTRLNVRPDTTVAAEYPDEYHALESESNSLSEDELH